MQHAHLTPKDVDDFLDAEGPDVATEIFLHLLAVCPECYKAGGALLEAHLAGDLELHFDGFDGALVLGRARAQELWRELAELDVLRRIELVQKDERFWSWGLAEILCQRSADMAAEEPAAAIEAAELAVEVSLLVKDWCEDGVWVDLLRGFAWAHLAEARSLAGDRRGAFQALSRAKTIWDPAFADAGDIFGYEARFVAITEGTRADIAKPAAGDSEVPALASAWGALMKAQALFDQDRRDAATLKEILGLLAQGLAALSLHCGGGS